MSKRDEKEELEPAVANNGLCVKCRRLLPASVFIRNEAGCMTAWCNACREKYAKNWGVDAHLLELVYDIYCHEQGLKNEAELVMTARVNMGQELPGALTDLRSRMHNHHMTRHSRIPEILRRFLADYREKWFYTMGMEVPEVVIPQPAGVAG